jgi:nitrite reductase (NADH) large subunit
MPRTGQAAQADQTESLIVPADDGREHLVVVGNGMAGCRAVEELLARDRAAIASPSSAPSRA